MNIFTLIFILSVFEDIPVLPEKPRATRRVNRAKAIVRNRRTYNNVVGRGIWFDSPDENGDYKRYASGNIHHKSQKGRWATERLSGHRRFAKWEKDYYGSPEVALDKYFQRIDKRQEKLDAERDANFYLWLTQGDEADDLLDELDAIKKNNAQKLKKYFYTIDNNHPGVIFVSKCKETLVKFSKLLREEGAFMSPLYSGAKNSIPEYSDVAAWPQCNIDVEWNGCADINPFYFWYYGT